MRNYPEQRNKSHGLYAILKRWYTCPQANRKVKKSFKQRQRILYF